MLSAWKAVDGKRFLTPFLLSLSALSARAARAGSALSIQRMPTPLLRAWHSLGPGAKMPPDRRFAKECRPNGWHSLARSRAQPFHPTGIVVDNASLSCALLLPRRHPSGVPQPRCPRGKAREADDHPADPSDEEPRQPAKRRRIPLSRKVPRLALARAEPRACPAVATVGEPTVAL